MRRSGILLAVLLFGVGAVFAGGSAARAAATSCWSNTFDTSITKLRVTAVSYVAQWRWCASNGRIVSFTVDKSYAIPGRLAKNAGIDIQPFRPGDFGRSSFDIYVNAWGDKKASTMTLTSGGVSVQLQAARFMDYYDISLNANGTLTGTKHKVR